MIPPVHIIKQSRYIKAFQRAGAVDEANARTLEELHLRDSIVFKRMITQGIFVFCKDERYYLNVPLVEVFRANRHYFLRIFFLVFLILLLAFITGNILK